MKTKKCSKCGEVKSLDEFYRNKENRSGRYSYCKKCQKESSKRWARDNPESIQKTNRKVRLKREYGITQAEYLRMLRVQKDGCAICGEKNHDGQELCIDHDHKTGRVRGLLCHNCNRALGLVEDDPERLKKLAAYVQNECTALRPAAKRRKEVKDGLDII